ncbi:MAG: hypothetical protein IIB11_05075 [Chloroflexi bacterium]|nr:hypothetical protein [Chloroflexota bacterium]
MSRIASRKSSFVIAAMLILTLVFSLVAVAAGNGGQGPPTVVSALGIATVQGETVLVDVIVVVRAGQNANEAARRALEGQGARPFDSANLGSEGFTLTGLVWDNLPVVQNYNPGSNKTEPEPVNGQSALTNTHTTWGAVTTSDFAFAAIGTTDRCPSLVRECKGRQYTDGNNDVAWMKINGCYTLGVTWFSTSKPEADMALNINFSWASDGVNDFDAQANYSNHMDTFNA